MEPGLRQGDLPPALPDDPMEFVDGVATSSPGDLVEAREIGW